MDKYIHITIDKIADLFGIINKVLGYGYRDIFTIEIHLFITCSKDLRK